MSQTASTLSLRNLHDVFGEIDPVRRRAVIDEIFHEDGVFYEPKGAYRGRDEIDRIAGVIKATHPDFQYQPISPPEEIGDACRVRWVSGSPGKPPAYAGTDFVIVRDGKIAAVYLFFDKLPNWKSRRRHCSRPNGSRSAHSDRQSNPIAATLPGKRRDGRDFPDRPRRGR